jgi:hypothetical protein
MQKGAQPTYFREPHIIYQTAACGSPAAVWPPLVYTLCNTLAFFKSYTFPWLR